MVTLIDLTPPPAPTPTLRPEQPAPAAPKPAPVKAPVHPARLHVKEHRSAAPNPIQASAPAATDAVADGYGAGIGDGEGLGGLGNGAGHGGPCDMAGRLEKALDADPLAASAVADAQQQAGRAGPIMIWNGDWVQSSNQDGKGLTAVREAVEWAIAFAPAACKAETVRGPVLLSLHGGARSARIALGYGEWRWSDLLNLGPSSALSRRD
jgi:hypothetical protein